MQFEISDPAILAITPLVSIHMLAYNHGSFIAEAIEGVIAQQANFPYELIIGEDCSTDNTLEIALDYQRRYPHLIRVIYADANVGMFTNGWRVLNACRGEYIAFCEGDDFWSIPTKLANQQHALQVVQNVDLCFHKAFCVNHKSETINGNYCDYGDEPKLILSSAVIEGDGGFIPTPSIMLRRSVLETLPAWFFDTSSPPPVGDYFLQVFGSLRGGALYLPMSAAAYRVGDSDSWTQKTLASQEQLNEFELSYIEFNFRLRKSLGPESSASIDKLIMHRFMNYCLRCYRDGQFDAIWSLISLMESHK